MCLRRPQYRTVHQYLFLYNLIYLSTYLVYLNMHLSIFMYLYLSSCVCGFVYLLLCLSLSFPAPPLHASNQTFRLTLAEYSASHCRRECWSASVLVYFAGGDLALPCGGPRSCLAEAIPYGEAGWNVVPAMNLLEAWRRCTLTAGWRCVSPLGFYCYGLRYVGVEGAGWVWVAAGVRGGMRRCPFVSMGIGKVTDEGVEGAV